MARKHEVDAGSGNVFHDLGYADAGERQLKVRLAIEVVRIIQDRRLTQSQAAKFLEIAQPHVSDLVRFRLNRFSVERLMEFLTRLGKGVEIRITKRQTRRARAVVKVTHVA